MYSLTETKIEEYLYHLRLDEKSNATIERYRKALYDFQKTLSREDGFAREDVILYKEELLKKYAPTTANVNISALNGFFVYVKWYELKIKPYKQQRKIFRDESKELTKQEYLRLLDVAKQKKDQRLYYILQTLGSTGIRVSELEYITVDALNKGMATVNCKNKIRTIILSKKLVSELKKYAKQKKIKQGCIFITRSGKAVDRSNVWAEMKDLCLEAQVDKSKVFPHNFRHLFAVSFYKLERDIAKLADLLGHASIETTRIYIMEGYHAHMKQLEKLGLIH